ncbi:MAG: hypothetical protein DDG58_10970, partial [Ardenticatenia bacterium]
MPLKIPLPNWLKRPARVTAIPDENSWQALLPARHVERPFWPPTAPADRPWHNLAQDLDDALEAWRKNFLIRQIVRLTTAYVVGDGITLSARHPYATTWLRQFWQHRQNRMPTRLAQWCDELTRAGELFIVLFPNPIDGMQYIRAIPARQIVAVETAPNDYESELAYLEQATEPGDRDAPPFTRRWKSPLTAAPDEPCMLHLAVNRPVGATRGESDLTPVLPWAQRYAQWLKDRVRFNSIRTDMATAWIKVQDETAISRKRMEYAANPPTGGNIFITGPGEEISFPAANIDAGDASPDGLALRLAIAAGANLPLHYLGEGASATRATAAEMGDPTRRHYRMRQLEFANFLCDLAATAWHRRNAILGTRDVEPDIAAETPDISREDNQSLAQAAHTIVQAFAIMKQNGWIDDRTAITMAFKFAGEVLTEEHIHQILQKGGESRRT